MDCFVSLIVFDELLDGFYPRLFDASRIGFNEAGNDMRDDERVMGSKLGDINCVIGDATVAGLVNEFVDEVAFCLEHKGGGCELVYDIYT